MTAENPPTAADDDTGERGEMERIVTEEERVLARVVRTLQSRRSARRPSTIDYDAELLNLRDQIKEARLEDIPPLIEEMERLQQVAARRAKVVEGVIDSGSPYFGRLVLAEDDRRREVLIGRATFLDSTTGIRIVDWRDAPISRVYYRYEEGDEYEETFGGREAEGEVLVRRSLAISHGKLKRIGCPQGTFVWNPDSTWRELAVHQTKLQGGQGAAMRPEGHHRPGRLGIGEDERGEDKHLSEITALIDPRQFDLITKPTSGLVVIQGGAGSGKTTIGLHRLAYLAYQDPKRFRPDKMLVVVFNDALVRYISRVLPALGVNDVSVVTYEFFAQKLRQSHVHSLPNEYAEDTPSVVVRLKKHPAMLRMIEDYVTSLEATVEAALVDVAKHCEGGAKPLRVWRESLHARLDQRLRIVRDWLNEKEEKGGTLPLQSRHAIGRVIKQARLRTRDVVTAWADLLTDRKRLGDAFAKWAPGEFTDRELDWAHSWCTRRCSQVISFREERLDEVIDSKGTRRSEPESDRLEGVDGIEEADRIALDREDDTLLLRLVQRMRGPLTRRREHLAYEHMFVDEAQDLSPVELAVVLDTVSARQSVTLAGDVAQRLHMDNGFSDWRSVLSELGLDHVSIEPLRLSYRSTHEILEFATEVLGPLRNEVSGQATRRGAPVELFQFQESGEAVGFLAEALRDLARAEPLASIAVIARYPEQADLYYQGLQHGEVPNLRRIADQDFPFRAGVDVTDVGQVKGLEFDYVILVDVEASTYPEDDEARHLLHIAATRAAHQLWVTTTGAPSPLLPRDLIETSL